MKSLSVEEIHIWKHKLGNRVLLPPSLMSGLGNPDKFLQEIGPIYFRAFILLPATRSFAVAVKEPQYLAVCGSNAFCMNKVIRVAVTLPLNRTFLGNLCFPSPLGMRAELASSFI